MNTLINIGGVVKIIRKRNSRKEGCQFCGVGTGSRHSLSCKKAFDIHVDKVGCAGCIRCCD